MENIELVIKIPEELTRQKVFTNVDLIQTIAPAVHNGTPLPKGHGRLIDEKELIDEIVCENIDGDYFDIIYAHSIYDASTIIEANKEDE